MSNDVRANLPVVFSYHTLESLYVICHVTVCPFKLVHYFWNFCGGGINDCVKCVAEGQLNDARSLFKIKAQMQTEHTSFP